MKAIVITEPGGPEVLELRDVASPVLGGDEVRIRVHATALNRADLLQRRGLYPPPPGASEILGLECAGVVTEVGAAASGVVVGTRVMALLAGGGYAEEVCVPARHTLPIPEGLGFEAAAAVPEAFLTAREALFTLGAAGAGDVVLIHGAAGGVGLAAVQLASLAGARVIGTVRRSEKRDAVAKCGAHSVVVTSEVDWAQRIREEAGPSCVDIIVDFVGAAYFERNVACLAEGGRLITVGLLGGAEAKLDLAAVLTRRLQILGLVMRTRSSQDKAGIVNRFLRQSWSALRDGRLVPVVSQILPLERAADAHRLLESNESIGKLVLCVRE